MDQRRESLVQDNLHHRLISSLKSVKMFYSQDHLELQKVKKHLHFLLFTLQSDFQDVVSFLSPYFVISRLSVDTPFVVIQPFCSKILDTLKMSLSPRPDMFTTNVCSLFGFCL